MIVERPTDDPVPSHSTSKRARTSINPEHNHQQWPNKSKKKSTYPAVVKIKEKVPDTLLEITKPTNLNVPEEREIYIKEEIHVEFLEPNATPDHSSELERPRVLPSLLTQFDCMNHFVEKNQIRRRCKLKGCSLKTTKYCNKCQVHLCSTEKRNCFVNFHTKV